MIQFVCPVQLRIDRKHHLQFSQIRYLIMKVMVIFNLCISITMDIFNKQQIPAVFQQIVFIRSWVLLEPAHDLLSYPVHCIRNVLDDMKRIDGKDRFWKTIRSNIPINIIHIDDQITNKGSFLEIDRTKISKHGMLRTIFENIDDGMIVEVDHDETVFLIPFSGEIELIHAQNIRQWISWEIDIGVKNRLDLGNREIMPAGNLKKRDVITFQFIQDRQDGEVADIGIRRRERIIFHDGMPAMRADETTVAKEDDRMGMLIDIMNDPFQTIFLYLGYESMTGRTADSMIDGRKLNEMNTMREKITMNDEIRIFQFRE